VTDDDDDDDYDDDDTSCARGLHMRKFASFLVLCFHLSHILSILAENVKFRRIKLKLADSPATTF
jgi:hypothetical protein